MRDTLDYNSTPMGYLSGFCELILLNLFFLVSCLPVVTIGAAVCGMYHVNLKTVRGESGSVWKLYWEGFRSNFRQATFFWILFLGLCLLLALDWWVMPVMLPAFYQIPRVMLIMVFAAACCMVIYVFPIVTRFVCTTRQAAGNALRMMAGHFPWTVLLLLLHGVIPILCGLSELFFLYAACAFLICGFSTINLIASHIFNRILKRYERI
ncbi:MAG: YesL family protein [Oscillospiraceae bacterium]|nr:YesL family protein [Oscillospiraceae bacterium]